MHRAGNVLHRRTTHVTSAISLRIRLLTCRADEPIIQAAQITKSRTAISPIVGAGNSKRDSLVLRSMDKQAVCQNPQDPQTHRHARISTLEIPPPLCCSPPWHQAELDVALRHLPDLLQAHAWSKEVFKSTLSAFLLGGCYHPQSPSRKHSSTPHDSCLSDIAPWPCLPMSFPASLPHADLDNKMPAARKTLPLSLNPNKPQRPSADLSKSALALSPHLDRFISVRNIFKETGWAKALGMRTPIFSPPGASIFSPPAASIFRSPRGGPPPQGLNLRADHPLSAEPKIGGSFVALGMLGAWGFV